MGHQDDLFGVLTEREARQVAAASLGTRGTNGIDEVDGATLAGDRSLQVLNGIPVGVDQAEANGTSSHWAGIVPGPDRLSLHHQEGRATRPTVRRATDQ